jgi:hypothetical protein
MTKEINLAETVVGERAVAARRREISRIARKTPKRLREDQKPGPAKVMVCTGMNITADQLGA